MKWICSSLVFSDSVAQNDFLCFFFFFFFGVLIGTEIGWMASGEPYSQFVIVSYILPSLGKIYPWQGICVRPSTIVSSQSPTTKDSPQVVRGERGKFMVCNLGREQDFECILAETVECYQRATYMISTYLARHLRELRVLLKELRPEPRSPANPNSYDNDVEIYIEDVPRTKHLPS